jgi:hypothetical protein
VRDRVIFTHTISRAWRRRWVTAAVAGLCLAAAPAASAAVCPGTVDGSDFASRAELRELVTQENGFGHRFLGSKAHDRTIDWIKDEIRSIDEDFKVRTGPYEIWSWLPRTKATDGPGLDLSRAGGLSVIGADGSETELPVAGAVRFSQPTGKTGQTGELVYLPREQEITAANSAGNVIVRDFPANSLPLVGLQLIGEYITPDLASQTGNYERPFLHSLQQELLAASQAGAAGVIYAFDLPRGQIAGYGDPHEGTIYKVPAVYVGGDVAAQLKALAAQGGNSARVVVRAKVERDKTRNLIATLPGKSPERMAFFANTDGQSWVQENGVSGLIALARYYAELPLRCRPKTLEIAFTSAHDAVVVDGAARYAARLDADYDEGSVAFAFAVEHLGTRELVPQPDPDGSGQRLVFTGLGEPFLFAAGDSAVLRQTAVAVTQRRDLDRTAVLRGLGLPTAQIPPICSMGGLGGFTHTHLVPTLAMISGPWSLYAPSFARKAIDFGRMRSQLLGIGDTALALDGLPRAQIAGDYPAMREQRAQGAPTCPPPENLPQFAPGPGE